MVFVSFALALSAARVDDVRVDGEKTHSRVGLALDESCVTALYTTPHHRIGTYKSMTVLRCSCVCVSLQWCNNIVDTASDISHVTVTIKTSASSSLEVSSRSRLISECVERKNESHGVVCLN